LHSGAGADLYPRGRVLIYARGGGCGFILKGQMRKSSREWRFIFAFLYVKIENGRQGDKGGMHMFEILIASKHSKDVNDKISKVFVDGFYQWLLYFSKDKMKLANAFSHMFNADIFYIALSDGQPCGIAACSDGKAKSVHLEKRKLQKHLGLIKGTLTYVILKREFEEKQYPFPIEPDMGFIEFVATSSNYRDKGVASEIITNIFNETPYANYVLEVADTNYAAVNLYTKLGFKEFKKVAEKHSKINGINYLVYMKYIK
jgi:ribosomal protein S18 acetylase RimI-like enzyme